MLVNGVEGFVVNMDEVLNLAKEREFIIKGKEMKIGSSQWAVNASSINLIMLRKIKGKYYFVPPAINFEVSSYDVALIDGKLNIYVFNKSFNDFDLDFAVLRLKDAYKYGFSGANERFDLYMKEVIGGGSLPVYVEVPKGYEVVGVTPDIQKVKVRLKDGEIIDVYSRGLFLALQDKNNPKKRAIFYMHVDESKYGIRVAFLFVEGKK